ncbi:MAG TPA: cation:proton antiporter [Dermatophilaceae bacterium]|nr:cation:proton antiporter [Dermatophilaceae bacterium]
MTIAVALLALAATVVGGSLLARRLGLSAPLLLTLVGIAAGYLPFVPPLHLPPEVVMLGLLPPLLYTAAIQTSLVDLGANRRNIGLLSVVLVLVPAVVVGIVVWRLLDVPLPLAIALGGVVAPPDAVAATAVARRIGLPRRIVTILEGESLFNDATALVVVRMGILAAGTAVTAWQVAWQFLWAAGGGIVVGIVVAKLVSLMRRRITDATTDTALGFLVPWLAFLPAEELHCSGVLAVVVAGVLLGHKAPVTQTAVSRTAERITWQSIAFVLEGAVFLLIGLQARAILDGVAASPLGIGRLVGVCAAALVTVLLVRPVVILTIQAFPRADVGLGDRLRAGAVASWAGMRGVVTLAAAFTLPEDAPEREVLLLIALVVTAGTLVLQGFSLPWVARALDLHGPDPREDVLQAAGVLQRAVAAGRAELARIEAAETLPAGLADALRAQGGRRTDAVWEQLGGRGGPGDESPTETARRLRLAMLAAERAEVLRLRDLGSIDHEVLRTVLAGLDLEEALVTTAGEARERFDERMLLTPAATRDDCAHLAAAAAYQEPATPEGCGACLREGRTDAVHLRLCLACGEVGCCDSSPGRHATAHFEATGHPVMRSFEPGEAWRWCYVDELLG